MAKDFKKYIRPSAKEIDIMNFAMSKFYSTEHLTGFIQRLFNDAKSDILRAGNTGIFVPTILDMSGIANGIYGVNALRFFNSFADFACRDNPDMNEILRHKLSFLGVNNDYLKLAVLALLSDIYPLVLRQNMPKSSIAQSVIYSAFDGKNTSFKMLFLNKKTVDEYEGNYLTVAKYFGVFKENYAGKTAFKQLAFGAKKCQDFDASPRFWNSLDSNI